MAHPFIDKDNSAFVEDPNFKRLIELFFGEGTKTTYRKEGLESYLDEPVQKILLVHTPHLSPVDASDRLVKFWGLMGEMKDYPMNLIIDVSYHTQEEYLNSEVAPTQTIAQAQKVTP